MANLVTLSRLFLLFGGVVPLAYRTELWALGAAIGLILAVFVLDAVDGWVARRFNECTVYGAAFDIAADRVVENVLWVVLFDLGHVPLWVPLVFLVRGLLVDSIRAVGASHGQAPFAVTRGRLGRFLVASRSMRLLYGLVKAVAFLWLFTVHAVQTVASSAWRAAWPDWAPLVGPALYVAAATLCLVRGAPVLLVGLSPTAGAPVRAAADGARDRSAAAVQQ